MASYSMMGSTSWDEVYKVISPIPLQPVRAVHQESAVRMRPRKQQFSTVSAAIRLDRSVDNMIAELRAAYQSGRLGARSQQFLGRFLARPDVRSVVGITMFPHLR